MSGNTPPDDVPEQASFPTVGQYEAVPGPGDAGYVAPEPEPDDSEGELNFDDGDDEADPDDPQDNDLGDEETEA
jgi:hypothetical protein